MRTCFFLCATARSQWETSGATGHRHSRLQTIRGARNARLRVFRNEEKYIRVDILLFFPCSQSKGKKKKKKKKTS